MEKEILNTENCQIISIQKIQRTTLNPENYFRKIISRKAGKRKRNLTKQGIQVASKTE